MKIRTPFQFTILLSLFGALFLVILTYLFLEKYLGHQYPISTYVIFFLSSFLSVAILVYFLLESFINQKIRLLYRMIQNYKLSKNEMKINMKEDVLSASETDIFNWVKSNRAEFAKLKQEEKFRREFIGNLAHELKTPIFSIQGYILTLLEGGIDDKNVNRKFLNIALNGVERMTQIIYDLDMITKFESEKIDMEFKENDLVLICKDIIESLALKAKEKQVTVQFSKNYDSPIKVLCDKSKISQVFQNLIVNAVNYSENNSTVSIRFINLGKNVLIEIEDEGIGIDEKHLNRLFERFYRVDKSRARNEGGTGLGLAIVKHIIEAHGHNIQVRSTVGKGSIFYFTLSKV
tara:strand:- start:1558 stop:2601 length:1044 start_codon:yes stop_codon:yes gene_type:complete